MKDIFASSLKKTNRFIFPLCFALVLVFGCAAEDETAVTSSTDTTTTTDDSVPSVTAQSPDNGTSSQAITSSITVTFDSAMDADTITTNTSGTVCSGSLQVSSDSFTSCITMSAAVCGA